MRLLPLGSSLHKPTRVFTQVGQRGVRKYRPPFPNPSSGRKGGNSRLFGAGLWCTVATAPTQEVGVLNAPWPFGLVGVSP